MAAGEGEGEVVVYDGVGISVIAFQTACHGTHKGVVHGAAQDAEMVGCGVGQAEYQIAGNGVAVEIADGDEGAAFG